MHLLLLLEVPLQSLFLKAILVQLLGCPETLFLSSTPVIIYSGNTYQLGKPCHCSFSSICYSCCCFVRSVGFPVVVCLVCQCYLSKLQTQKTCSWINNPLAFHLLASSLVPAVLGLTHDCLFLFLGYLSLCCFHSLVFAKAAFTVLCKVLVLWLPGKSA